MPLPVFLILFVLGIILAIVGGIMNLVFSFQESMLWGLAVFLVPLASLVFTIMFWGRPGVRKALFLGLGGLLLMLGSLIGLNASMPGLAERFAAEAKDGTFNPSEIGMVIQPDGSTASLPSEMAADKNDRFYSGVKHATTAATLTQTAKSKADWKKVATHWDQAIARMEAVPAEHPKHAVAQTKVAEYQKNLAYAQQNAQQNAQ
jgi:hypothetical protein